VGLYAVSGLVGRPPVGRAAEVMEVVAQGLCHRQERGYGMRLLSGNAAAGSSLAGERSPRGRSRVVAQQRQAAHRMVGIDGHERSERFLAAPTLAGLLGSCRTERRERPDQVQTCAGRLLRDDLKTPRAGFSHHTVNPDAERLIRPVRLESTRGRR
jgi:hypothetical protein